LESARISLLGKGVKFMALTVEEKARLKPILDMFKDAGLQIVPLYRLMNPAISMICLYQRKPRPVHKDVCKWHQEENDPECSDCERNTHSNKKLSRNSRPKGRAPAVQAQGKLFEPK
jgi:hypothetical protein